MQRSEAHGPGEGLKAGRSHRKGVGGFWNTLVLSRASVAPCSLFHAGKKGDGAIREGNCRGKAGSGGNR